LLRVKHMAMDDNDRKTLQALQTARAEHKELAELLDFYYELYELLFQAKAELPAPQVRDELARRWRLEMGIPQLTFDQLAPEPASFARLVMAVADLLLRHTPTWQVDRQGWTPDALLAVAQELFETWETLTAPKVGQEAQGMTAQPLFLAVGFALAPYLQRAAEEILPQLDLSLWVQGYCPVCGGRPNFAFFDQERGARHLLCSRCGAMWGYSRSGCPFCQSKEKQTYYQSEDGVYRLYLCPACGQYLKTMDLREVQRPVYPLVERLMTVGMDLAVYQCDNCSQVG